MSEEKWDDETELLVFGSGAAGLMAALVGASEGLAVILCEKAPVLGGTTAISGGGVWIAGSKQAARAGYRDSIEQGREYLKNELGSHARDDLIDAFTRTGPEVLDYLEDKTRVAFDVISLPDYHAETSGGLKAGRVFIPKPFDGRTLGPDFRRIAPPMKRMMVFGGMMASSAEIPALLRPFASWQNLRFVIGSVLRYGIDRLRYPRGTRLLNGNALIARLVSSIRTTSADLRLDNSLVELVRRNGRVVGAVVRNGASLMRITAKIGIVLATGGPAQSSPLQRDLMRDFPHLHTAAAGGATGDGVRLGLEIGAAVDTDVSSPAVWTPASVIMETNGAFTVFPYGYLDRGKPGAIAVDGRGRRFVNEASSYHDVVKAMYKNTPKGAVPRAHLLCDSAFIRRYGLGMVRPYALGLRSYVKRGYLISARSLAELAWRLGVDRDTLADTVVKHNNYAKTGVDEEFAKGSTAFNRANGDPTVRPNPNLRPIESAPFYALPMTPATLGTSIGLKTNEDAQVLDTENVPIAGLYACGNDMTSVMRGCCPGGGITLGPALVFAYRAARHAVKLAATDSTERSAVDTAAYV